MITFFQNHFEEIVTIMVKQYRIVFLEHSSYNFTINPTELKLARHSWMSANPYNTSKFIP